jgi:hypothetical protein
MAKKKLTTYIVTGKTEKQLVDEMKAMELADKEGLEAPPARTCYLCRRGEGQNTLLLIDEDPDNATLTPLQLDFYSIQVEEDVILKYLVCQECSVLLNLGEDFIDEDESCGEDSNE